MTAKSNELQTAKRDKDALLGDARSHHQQLEGQKAQRQMVVNELNKKQSALQSTIAQQRKKQQRLDAQIDRLIKQEIAAAEARRKREEAARKAAEARRKREAAARAKAEAARRARNKKTPAGKTNGVPQAAPPLDEEAPAQRHRAITRKTMSTARFLRDSAPTRDACPCQSLARMP